MIFLFSWFHSFTLYSYSLTPDPNIFLWIAASVADAAAAVIPNGIKTLLANGFDACFIGNPVFSNGPKMMPKNLRGCPILCNWVFDNFILAYEPFAKA